MARKTLIDSLIAKFKESMHDFFAEVAKIIIIARNKFEIELNELSISDISIRKDVYICACLFQCSFPSSFEFVLYLIKFSVSLFVKVMINSYPVICESGICLRCVNVRLSVVGGGAR